MEEAVWTKLIHRQKLADQRSEEDSVEMKNWTSDDVITDKANGSNEIETNAVRGEYLTRLMVADNDPQDGCKRESAGLLHDFNPLLNILTVFGYFPKFILEKRGRVECAYCAAFYLCVALAIAFFLYLFKMSIVSVQLYQMLFNFLHAMTITSIISSLKSLVIILNLFVFGMRVCSHRVFLHKLHKFNEQMQNNLQVSCRPNCGTRIVVGVYVIPIILTVVMITIRIIEMISMGEKPFTEHIITDISFFVLPLMTVWKYIPMFYFYISNEVIRFWAEKTQVVIKRDSKSGRKPVKFFFKQLMNIAETQEAMSDAFNPYILFSLAWSMFTLCLTIYFVTQRKDLFSQLPAYILESTPHAPRGKVWQLTIIFNMIYGSMQVLLAAVMLTGLCYIGVRTNEETRRIVKCLLEYLPEEETEQDRFYVTCCMHKLQSQYMWGVSVLRAIPLERSAFFTTVSLILTYAFLLLRFREGSISPLLPPPFTNSSEQQD